MCICKHVCIGTCMWLCNVCLHVFEHAVCVQISVSKCVYISMSYARVCGVCLYVSVYSACWCAYVYVYAITDRR